MTTPLYDNIGRGYARYRKPDPRIAAAISAALGDAGSVINVGAGSGSYEPTDREVLAIEPSEVMRAQRPPGAARCIAGVAEELPVPTASYDAAMALLTIHHWRDWRRGIAELRRVARQRVVIFTFDVEAKGFWLTDDYFPEFPAWDKQNMPPIVEVASELGGAQITTVPIPHDCTDGFLAAYWRRPEAYLDDAVRQSISTFSMFDARLGLARLAEDLKNGRWRQRYGHLLTQSSVEAGYCLLVA